MNFKEAVTEAQLETDKLIGKEFYGEPVEIGTIRDLPPLEKNEEAIDKLLLDVADEIVTKMKNENNNPNVGYDWEYLGSKEDDEDDEIWFNCEIRMMILSNTTSKIIFKVLLEDETIEHGISYYDKFEEILVNKINDEFKAFLGYEIENDMVQISVREDTYNDFENVLQISIMI